MEAVKIDDANAGDVKAWETKTIEGTGPRREKIPEVKVEECHGRGMS